MPGPLRVRNKRTGQILDIDWNDPTRPPSQDEIRTLAKKSTLGKENKLVGRLNRDFKTTDEFEETTDLTAPENLWKAANTPIVPEIPPIPGTRRAQEETGENPKSFWASYGPELLQSGIDFARDQFTPLGLATTAYGGEIFNAGKNKLLSILGREVPKISAPRPRYTLDDVNKATKKAGVIRKNLRMLDEGTLPEIELPETSVTGKMNPIGVFNRIQAPVKSSILSGGIPGTAANIHGFSNASRYVRYAKNPIKAAGEAAEWILNPSKAREYLRGSGAAITSPSSLSDIMSSPTHRTAYATMRGVDIDFADTVAMARESRMPSPNDVSTLTGKGLAVGSKIWNKVLDVQEKYFERPLFQDVLPAMKVKRFYEFRDDLMSSGVVQAEAEKAAAEAVNYIHGGNNINRDFARSSAEAARAILLAPDWLYSSLKTHQKEVMSMLSPSTPEGKIYRRAVQNFAGITALLQEINIANTGHSTFQNEIGHEFDIQLGEVDVEGGGKKKIWLSSFGSDVDIPKVFTTAIRALATGAAPPKRVEDYLTNKLNVLTRRIYDIGFAHQTPMGKPIGWKDKYGNPVSGMQNAEALLWEGAQLLPSQAATGIDMMTGQKSKIEGLSKLMELPIRFEFDKDSAPKRGRKRKWYNPK